MTPSAYMRRHTYGRVRANPSAYARRLARANPPAARPRKKRTAKRPAGTAVQALRLGRPLELLYRHQYGGTYVHKFGPRTRVYVTKDRKHLVISGIDARMFIEG